MSTDHRQCFVRQDDGPLAEGRAIRIDYRCLPAAALWLLLVFGVIPAARADTVTVTLQELSEAIDALESDSDAVQHLVLRRISDELSAAGLTLGAGDLLFDGSVSDLVGSDSCNRSEIRRLEYTVSVASDTRLGLSLSSLVDPIRLRLAIDTIVDASGRAKQLFGVRLGSCRILATDNFDFRANGLALMSLELVLRLNPVLEIARQRLILRPQITLTGELSQRDIRVDVDDSLLRRLLEASLQDEIDEALDAGRVHGIVVRLQQWLNDSLASALDEGMLIVDLPDPSDEQVDRLYQLFSPEGDFTLTRGYLRARRLELMAALILADGDRLEHLFGEAAQCQAAGILQVPLSHEPLYRQDEVGCRADRFAVTDVWQVESLQVESLQVESSQVQSIDIAPWYVDPDCQQPVNFRATSTLEFCRDFIDTQRLGNAASRVEQLQQWTLSPGTRFDIGAIPLATRQQPFTQRVKYKSVTTRMGQCELEMRIHAPSPTIEGRLPEPGDLRPLIAFHGGSGLRRSSGALGIESFATQLVNRGFVVFAPFYRLIGDAEGTEQCNRATLEQVLEDASDALTWALQHAHEYGAIGRPVVFGQSAGGHLAAVLAVERAAEIASAVLFYAPVDFADFIRQLNDGGIESVTGQRILEAVMNETLDSMNVADPRVQRNTLPARILRDSNRSPPKPLPPFFLLHGRQDSMLPYRQSLRLCNALAGLPLDAPMRTTGASVALRQIVTCGTSGSQLHLITEGEHGLDLCIAEELCLAGSPASAALTRESVEQMLLWINTVPETRVSDKRVP